MCAASQGALGEVRVSAPRPAWTTAGAWRGRGRPALLPRLDGCLAVSLRGAITDDRAARWSADVLRARRSWTRDFGGEQFALGRAFYTHLETDRAAEYFANAAASDAHVEATLPGMQAEVRGLFAELVGGIERKRRGFCGPGVHVFPAGEVVARRGGVVHFDTEGLSPHHLLQRARALSLIIMLQSPARGGGLRIWDVHYEGHDAATDDELARPAVTVPYRPGDALLMDSYRLHQIRPFTGPAARISITLHAVEVDRGVWETWF